MEPTKPDEPKPTLDELKRWLTEHAVSWEIPVSIATADGPSTVHVYFIPE